MRLDYKMEDSESGLGKYEKVDGFIVYYFVDRF